MPATVLLATTMTWPFPAQLAGAFHAVGARVQALCPGGAVLASSRHVARTYRYHPWAPGPSLRRAIRQSGADLVIPCDDQAALVVQRVRGTPRLDSRTDFLARAAKAGAPVAESLAIGTDADLEAALTRWDLPLVLKCDHSWGGDGVVVARTRDAARRIFHRMQETSRLRDLARAAWRRDSHFLTRALFPTAGGIGVQRFITGHPATSSLACWNGRLLAAHHFDVLATNHDKGPAALIRRTDCARMQDSAVRVAAAFNLSGLFGLDYMRDQAGDVHLLELNARATPTAHLALGQDLAAALLTAAGFPARSRPAVTPLAEIALFPREWLRQPASPWLQQAFHDVPWSDPAVVQATLRALPAIRLSGPAEAQDRLAGSNVPDLLTLQRESLDKF